MKHTPRLLPQSRSKWGVRICSADKDVILRLQEVMVGFSDLW